MKFMIHVSNDTGDWWETFDKPEITTVTAAQAWAEDTVAQYNQSLYKGDKPRTLIGVQPIRVPYPTNSLNAHSWVKNCLVTQEELGSGLLYDRMRCTLCGAEGRRYGLSDSVSPMGSAKKGCKGKFHG